jgi:hypothetical protein
MSKVQINVSISLDGFMAGPNVLESREVTHLSFRVTNPRH